MVREVEVSAALIRKGGKILLAQRMPGDDFALLWEFPGGKVEEGEAYQSALEREIKEELGLNIKAGRLVSVFEDQAGELRIKVFLYDVEELSGETECIECNNFGFFSLEEAKELNLAPADKKIVDYLSLTGIS